MKKQGKKMKIRYLLTVFIAGVLLYTYQAGWHLPLIQAAYSEDIDEDEYEDDDEDTEDLQEHETYVDEQNVVYGLLEDGTCFVEGYTSELEQVVVIPKEIIVKEKVYTVTKIGDGAFYKCDLLTDITFPETITVIGDMAFYECNNVEKIVLPEGVKEIKYGAFCCCEKLVYLQIPATVTEINDTLNEDVYNKNLTIYGYLNSKAEEYAVDLALKFSPIGLDKDTFVDEQGVIYSLHEGHICSVSGYVKTLSGNVQIPAAIVSDGEVYAVTEIDDRAFDNCTFLDKVIIPESVEKIGYNVFYDCPYVVLCGYMDEKNYQNDSSKANSYAGEYDLEYKTLIRKRIKKFTDEQGVKYIFRNDGTCYVSGFAEKMESNIVIPSTISDGDKSYFVTEVEPLAFINCTTMESITLPDTVTRIDNGAFEGCTNLVSVKLPQSILNIGQKGFKNCSSLVEITLPMHITLLDTSVFEGCSSLKTVTFPKNLETIASDVFLNCTSLECVQIPKEVKNMGPAFGGCDRLTGLSVAEDNSKFCSDENGCIYTKDGRTLVQCSPVIKKLEIPDTVVKFYFEAFENCRALETLEMPANIKLLEDQYDTISFNGCVNLRNLSVDEDNPNYASDQDGNIYNKAKTKLIQGAPAATMVIVPGSVVEIAKGAFENRFHLERVVISKGVKKLGLNVFSGCRNLESISIPASVKEIGYEAFSGCEKLTDIAIASANKQFSADKQGAVYNKDKTKLIFASQSQKSIVIPSHVKVIDDMAFSGSTVLEIVTIPRDIERRGCFLFQNCIKLKTVHLPCDAIWTVARSDFFRCSSLEELTLPCGGSVEDFAMLGCNSLKRVTFLGLNSYFTEYAFDDYNDDLVIYGYEGADAQKWAKEYGITFSSLGTPVAAKKNTILTAKVNKCKVKVLSSSKKPTVSYLKTTDPNATNITIGDTVEIEGMRYQIVNIADNAFTGNKKLKQITINSKKMTSIGKNAFKNCTSLNKMVINTTLLKSIGSCAFYGDKNLKNITIKSSVLKTVGSSALKSTNKKLAIKVPGKKVSAYKKLFKGKGNKKVTVKK